MKKGQQTRAAILDKALEIASSQGLEGITIGLLAEQIGKSKSGVFAHFGSREDLQLAVLQAYETRFIETVLKPSLKEARGLPRLQALFVFWLDRVVQEINAGCVYISGASEYDDRPGAVRDMLVRMHVDWQQAMKKAVTQAVEVGHVSARMTVDQWVFEMTGLVLAAHQQGRLLNDSQAVQRAQAGFERLIQHNQIKQEAST